MISGGVGKQIYTYNTQQSERTFYSTFGNSTLTGKSGKKLKIINVATVLVIKLWCAHHQEYLTTTAGMIYGKVVSVLNYLSTTP
jgi:hypothetical protein